MAITQISSESELALQSALSELETMVGGRQKLIMGLVSTKSLEAHKFVAALQKVENQDLSLWQVCRKLKTSPDELLQLFQEGKLVRQTVQAYIKLADSLPDVMDAAIISSKVPGPDGYKDRELLFRSAGIAKEGGGVQVNLNQQINQKMDAPGSFERLVTGASTNVTRNPFDVVMEGELVEEPI